MKTNLDDNGRNRVQTSKTRIVLDDDSGNRRSTSKSGVILDDNVVVN